MATVSDAAVEQTLQFYANPLLIQDHQLKLFEEHVFDGKSVLDGNNVFTFGLEMDATLTASIVNEMVNNFQALYPSRAQTMSDLYRHLSDYDYIDMFSTPSETTVELIFDRDFLINNAPVNPDNNDENLIVLPNFSTFKIGEHKFGIHYPIRINIRKAYKADGVTIDYDNCIFQVVWDTTTVNPLYRLTTNILEHRFYKREGLTLLCIAVPIHQFAIEIIHEDTIPSTGFIKRYTYDDNFYAMRVFHYVDNTWVEMSETLSDVIYNPNEPVAKVKVMSDVHMVEVSIPQVCFTEGMIGNRILCLLYTTEGALDLDIRNYNINQFSASFLFNDQIIDTTYSKFLKRIPYLQMVPLTSRINSGSNGKTFEEMKNRIMNSVGGDDLLVTPAQIAAHLSDIGFNVTKYVDNITDRIYLASKVLTDSAGNIISAGEFKTTLTSDMFLNAETIYDTIRIISDISDSREYMIMPNTLFKYDTSTDSMYPLSKYQVKKLFQNMSVSARVAELNNNIYTFTPFHIKLSADETLPMAGAYDLLTPSLYNVSFSGENYGTISQVALFASQIIHQDNGVGGYLLTIALYTTSDLGEYAPVDDDGNENIAVILRTKSIEESPMYIKGVYNGMNSDGKYLINFKIGTDYKVDEDNCISTTTFTLINDYETETSTNYVKFIQDYELMFFASDQLVKSSEAKTISNKQPDIPKSLRDMGMVWLATQTATIKLGEPIANLMSNVSLTIQGERYNTYQTTEFAAYISDLYRKYETEIIEPVVIWESTEVKEDQVYYRYNRSRGGQPTPTKNPEHYDRINMPVGTILKSIEGSEYYAQFVTHYIGDLKFDEETLQPIIDKYAGDLILTNETVTVTDPNYTGLRAPAFVISTKSYNDFGEEVASNEVLYMSCKSRTTLADVSNIWYPFRAYRDPESQLYNVVYSGSKTKADVTNDIDTIGHEATIVKVEDLMKVMLDTIDLTASTAIVEDVQAAQRIYSIYSDRGDIYRAYGYKRSEDDPTKYVLDLSPESSPINKHAFIYIKHVMKNNEMDGFAEDDDTRIAPFRTVKETRVNQDDATYNYYDLKATFETNKDKISFDPDRPISWNGYGALYRRDFEAASFDYSTYLTEDELCHYYQDVDELYNERHSLGYKSQLEVIYKKYDIDATVAAKLDAFRFPWIKVIETDGDSYNHIRLYWNSRSINNFRVQYQHSTDEPDDRYTLTFITKDRIDADGAGSVSGVMALRYLQECSVNINEIPEYLTTADVQTPIMNDELYRLYWVANYNAEEDIAAGNVVNWDGSKPNTPEDLSPLVSKLESSPFDPIGALLWSAHNRTDALAHKHYVVVIGPSKLKCYNELMKTNTFSGMCYKATTYDAREFAHFDELNRISDYTAAVASYIASADTSVNTDKAYFVRSGTAGNYTYSQIPNPTGNPETQGWYEIEFKPGKYYYTQDATHTDVYHLVLEPKGKDFNTYYELTPLHEYRRSINRSVPYTTEEDAEYYTEYMLTHIETSDNETENADPLRINVCVFENNLTSSYRTPDLRLIDQSIWESFWPWESTNWYCVYNNSTVTGTMLDLGMSMTIADKSLTDAKILHKLGDIQMDETGLPVVNQDDNARKLIYKVNMIHCDYKPLESQSSETVDYRTDIQDLLRSWFNVLTATKPQLLERTELYFTPIKTMGYGLFKGSNGDVISHPLEIRIALRIYATPSTLADTVLKDQIKTNIISLIDQHTSNGSISCTVLANEIRNAMPDSILYVDVLGINGDPDVQTLISTDPSKYAVRLKTILAIDESGSVVTEKGVDIVWSSLR